MEPLVSPPLPLFVNTVKHDPDLTRAQKDRVLNGPAIAVLGTHSDPVDFLLDLMDEEPSPDFSPEQRLFHDSLRLKAAIAAAPFLRPKLAQVEHRGNISLTHEQALSELEDDNTGEA